MDRSLVAAFAIDEESLAVLERIFTPLHFVHHQFGIDLKHAKKLVYRGFR